MGNYESLAILLFIALMVYLFDRKNFTREGIVFLRRTKKGLEMIDRAAIKHPRLITFLADAGIVFSFGLIGLRYLFIQKKIEGLKRVRHYATYLLIFTLVSYIIYPVFFLGIIDAFKIPAAFSSPVIFILIALTFLFGVSGYGFMTLFFGAFSIAISTATGTDVESSIKLVLPIDMPKDSTIPVFYVPITEWLISILFILIVHEFSHAIVARVEGIKVKSLGYGFFGPLPLGFAEPDEKEIKKSASLTKTRIFGAGSFSNILAAVILLIIFITTMTAGVSSGAITFKDNGLIIASVDAGMPAGALPNTTIGSQLTSVDGTNITNISEFVRIMGTKNIGDNVTLLIDSKEYELTLVEDPKNNTRGIIGIKVEQDREMAKGAFITSLITWIILLNIGIALANLFPLRPLDGGLMLEEILIGAGIKDTKRAAQTISKTTLFLLLFSLIMPWLISIFG